MALTEPVVRGFLAEKVLPDAAAQRLDANADLIKLGILDSLTFTHLIVFLEQRFGFIVKPAEFNIENFSSIRCICEFVDAKERSAES